MYEVIGLKPSLSGRLTLTNAPALLANAAGAPGWLGIVAVPGVTAFEAIEG